MLTYILYHVIVFNICQHHSVNVIVTKSQCGNIETFATGQLSTGYNNSCLYQRAGLNRDGPKNFDCERFVIDSTDQLWNMYRGIIVTKSFRKEIQENIGMSFFVQILPL